MKVIKFILELFRKFPGLLITNTVLLVIVNLLATCALFSISPLIDFFLHPDLKGVSPITLKAVSMLEFVGLPVTIVSWLGVFMVFVFLSSAFLILARYFIIKTQFVVQKDIMIGAFEDFFDARWYFFSGGKQGVLLNTFTRELNVVGNAFSAMGLFFAGMLQMIFFLAVPFCISWQVTIISLIISLLFVIPFILLGKISYGLGRLNTETSNKVTSVLHEDLSLAKVVLGFGNQAKSIKNLSDSFDAHLRVAIKSLILNIGIPILYSPFGVIMISIALLTARWFLVPLSEIMVLLLALRQVAVSVGNMASQKNYLENFFPSYQQIEALRERARDLKRESGDRKFDGFSNELVIKDLTFAYPGNGPVLKNINVRIPKSKMVAFIGESGSGKSTLIDMIMGFHEPTDGGDITFDGTPLEKFDINTYRQRIGYVPQDSVLFNMTIKENLLWAVDEATDEDIVKACRQANADEFIDELPEKYDTVVGDRGVRLSGGQIQRIALARAILRKPELLILDEATSSLDTQSERLIQKAIENIAKETTVIVIAHRLSTIVNADYVYVLKDGNIIEEGTYQEIVKMEGHFNKMVKLQSLD
ncbi:ABC transporter ATP-binding protein [Candidatus Omnitrophota bacterium]